MTTLRTNMISDMTVRGLSKSTQESYLRAVTGLAKYYQRAPDEISQSEVQNYLVHLSQERGLAWSSCNVASHAFRFIYRTTLRRDEAEFHVPCAKEPSRLPEILSGEEVSRLFEHTTNTRQASRN